MSKRPLEKILYRFAIRKKNVLSKLILYKESFVWKWKQQKKGFVGVENCYQFYSVTGRIPLLKSIKRTVVWNGSNQRRKERKKSHTFPLKSSSIISEKIDIPPQGRFTAEQSKREGEKGYIMTIIAKCRVPNFLPLQSERIKKKIENENRPPNSWGSSSFFPSTRDISTRLTPFIEYSLSF